MKQLGKIIQETKFPLRPKNLHTEFQQYGVWLCEQLGDLKNYSLYIKLAKQTERALIEEALTFTKGYTNAKSKGRVFMWRLKQLKDGSTKNSVIPNASEESQV
jgi:hypothetical protein